MLTHAECFAIVVKSFEEAGALRNAATERCMLAVSLEYLGQHEEAEAMLRRNLLECQRLKSTQALMFTKVSLARVLAFRRSATKEIRGFLEEAIAYYTSASHMRWLAISNLTYARLEFAAGNYQAALTRTLLASEQMPRNSLHYAMVQATLARSLVAVQQPEEALPLGRAALHGARQRGGFLMDDLEPPIALTEVLLALNKTDEARQVITETQKYIRRRCDALTGEQRKEAYLAVPDRVYVSKLARELV